MLKLPFDQIVRIQASLAFVNLAPGETRRRRHRKPDSLSNPRIHTMGF